jgi:Gpi18-like mannosyltransferase
MKSWFKNNWKLILFWMVLILMRFGLSFLPAHSDIRIQTEWAKWMYVNGSPKGLYNWNVWGCIWPNHPPLISWVYFESYKIHSLLMWWMSSLGNFIAMNRLAPTKFIWFFNFIKWFGSAKYETTEYLLGVIVVIKQIMVLADFVVAWIIYKICKINKTDWKKYVLAYLLLPFSWYLSAVWGQSNQLSFIFLIISFVLLTTKRSIWSPLFYAIAINLKPDCVFLIPLYLFVWLRQKQPWRNLILGGLLAGIFSLWTVTWFTDGKLTDLLFLLAKRLNTDEGLVTLNAFNFWYVFYPFPSKIAFDNWIYLGISAKIWGYIFWLIITGLSFRLINNKKPEKIYLSIFMVGFGSWLFMTGMHERYAFYSLVALLFYSLYKKVYFKYFVILSIIFFLSMFYVFSVPQCLDGIKIIFNWGGQIIPRLLSLINIFIFLKIFSKELKALNKNRVR